jgi:4-hydroxy-tetrahydrodipicolinate synthase
MSTTQKLEPGVWGILATPFIGPRLSVDTDSLVRLVEHYRQIGATGVVALGVLGEAARLDAAERESVLRHVVEAARPMSVVAGTGATSTQPAVEEAKRAADCGARYVMILVPTAQADVLADHLHRISEASELGIVLQDHPQTTGVVIPPSSLAQAAVDSDVVVAIKAESPPTAPTVATFVAIADIPVFGGLGGVGLLDELLAGSAGAMTGFAFPEALVATVRAWRSGAYQAARAAYLPWMPLVIYEAQDKIGLALRKEILRRRGLIAEASVRLPGVPAPASALQALEAHLEAVQPALDALKPSPAQV